MAAKAEAVARDSAPPLAEKSKLPASVPDWQEEPWTSPNSRKIRLVRLTYRWRVLLWVLWWVLLSAAAATAYLFSGELLSARLSSRPIQLLSEPWVWVLSSLLGIFLLGSFLLVGVFGWFGMRFRYLAW